MTKSDGRGTQPEEPSIDWSTLGRRNKNRGYAWERRVADTLGWTRVGKIRHTLQKGDVVDGFWGRNGNWIGECKTQPRGVGNLNVTDGYHKQLYDSGLRSDRYPALFLHLVPEPSGWAILPWTAISFIVAQTGCEPDVVWTTKSRGRGYGFTIQRRWINKSLWDIAQINVSITAKNRPARVVNWAAADTKMIWWLMRLSYFKEFIDKHKLWVPDDGPVER